MRGAGVLNIEAQVEPHVERFQRQKIQAILLWILLLLLAHIFSPFLLLALLIYRFCCIRADQRNHQSKLIQHISIIVAVYVAVSGLPIVAIALYYHIYNAETVDSGDAFLPFWADLLVMLWSTVVAFRLFSLPDSYEPEESRKQVNCLEEIPLNPPLKFNGKTLHTGLELYMSLKGRPQHITIGLIVAGILALSSTATVRSIQWMISKKKIFTHQEILLSVISSIYFSGMLFFLLSSFALMIIQYSHQVSFIYRLTECIDEKPNNSKENHNNNNNIDNSENENIYIDAFDIENLWIWEECRRLAVEELTSSQSVLNAMLIPSLWLNALGAIVIFIYLVVNLLFLRNSCSLLSLGLMVLFIIFISFIVFIVFIAKLAQSYFRWQTSIIAQRTFDVARVMDVFYTNATESIGGTFSQMEDQFNFTKTFGLKEKYNENKKEKFFTLPHLQRCYASLHSICTYMVAEDPSLHILGVELRNVGFLVVFALLLSGNVLLISLMIAMAKGKCKMPH